MQWVHTAAGVTMGPLVSAQLCHDHCQVCTGGVQKCVCVRTRAHSSVFVCVHACVCMRVCAYM